MGAIVKNEKEFLVEWIAYHRLMGIEHFIIADNESDDGTRELLDELSELGYLDWFSISTQERASKKAKHARAVQLRAYDTILEQASNKFDFVAFLDADEFLFMENNNLLDLLKGVPQKQEVVVVNWACFGSSNRVVRRESPVLERFYWRASKQRNINCHTKCLVRPSGRLMFINPHFAVPGSGGYAGRIDGSPVEFINSGGITKDVCWRSVRVNHYVIKSYEEYINKKRSRGRAMNSTIRPLSFFQQHDFSDELDDSMERICVELKMKIKEISVKLKSFDGIESTRKNLKSKVFFVHIPKTGGTSFRLGIKESLREEQIFQDYGAASSETSAFILDKIYKKKDFYSVIQASRFIEPFFLGGHVNAAKYKNVIPPYLSLTFLRRPVDQVLSHFEHYKKHHGYSAELEVFVAEERFRNIQSRYLQNVPVESFGVVGLTEEYAKSLELVNDYFGLAVPVLHSNKGGGRMLARGLVTVEQQLLIEKYNSKDIILYERAKELFRNRMLLKSNGEEYVHGKVANIVNNQVIGWAFHVDNIEPVELDVLVNGELVGHVVANQFRSHLKELNFPNEGFVGFSFVMPEQLRVSDIVVCRVSSTSQELCGIQTLQSPTGA